MTVSSDSPDPDSEGPVMPGGSQDPSAPGAAGGENLSSQAGNDPARQAGEGPAAKASAASAKERLAGLTCAQVEKMIKAFLAGSLSNRAAVAMRAHLGQCRNCLVRYREGVQSAGSLSRNIRQARQRTPREKLRKKHRRMIAGLEGARGAKRSAHIKLMLLPLALIFMFRCFDGMRGTKAEAAWKAGSVEIGADQLTADQKEREIQRGDWVVTQVGGSAEIAIRSDLAQLGSDSQVLLESARDRRLRLRRGELLLRGSWQVATTQGIITLDDGRAEIGLRNSKLTITCTEGEVIALNHLGERRIPAGSPALQLDAQGQGIRP